jgi:hypothetical protein
MKARGSLVDRYERTLGAFRLHTIRLWWAFPAWFFFAAMKAIGVDQVRLEDV